MYIHICICIFRLVRHDRQLAYNMHTHTHTHTHMHTRPHPPTPASSSAYDSFPQGGVRMHVTMAAI